MADTQVNPQAFKDMIVSKYPDGVASDGTRYADMDPVKLTQSVVNKYPDGVTNAGVKYSDYIGEQTQTPENTSGAWFSASPNDTPVEAGLKTAGNVIPSTINTGVGIVKGVAGLPGQLLDTLKTASDTGNAYNDAQTIHEATIRGAQKLIQDKKMKGLDTTSDEKALAGIMETSVPNRGLETLKAVPGAALQTLEGILPFLKPALKGDLQGVSAEIENNPVGNILPIVTAIEGGARGIDRMSGATDMNAATAAARASGASPAELAGVPNTRGISPVIDAGISRTAQLVTKPVGAVADFAKNKIADATRFGVSQATGLEPNTIKIAMETPKNQMQGDRVSVARQVENGLQTRINDLSETGKEYAPIRRSVAPVRVEPTFLNDLFEKNTGLTVQETPVKPTEAGTIQLEPQKTVPGKLVSGPSATIRDAGDVSRLQKIYNTYQPLFESGTMTPNEFLNLRSDLADAANYESKNGRSAPVEAAANRMRGQLNSEYRSQIPGLETIDNSFYGQISELNDLRKGLLDNQGNLTDTAINRIANAIGKGKDLMLARLEQIIPGITKKIQIVQAIEDIEHTGGPKVGTYARGSAGPLGVYGLFTGNIPLMVAGLGEAIISSPKFAVPILRAYGASSEVVAGVLKNLKGYLNPNMTNSRGIPFMPRSNTQAINPSPIQ